MGLTGQTLVDRHAAGVSAHQPIPTFAEMISQGAELPHILIIACADPRCTPEDIFKVKTGGNSAEAVVLRTAGGNAQHVMSSVLALDTMLHFTDTIIVQHTDCGATMFRDENVKGELKKRAPGSSAEIDGFAFGEITGSIAENVKKSMAFLKESPLVAENVKAGLQGFVFDIKTGTLEAVK